jgi:hypothetical protein
MKVYNACSIVQHLLQNGMKAMRIFAAIEERNALSYNLVVNRDYIFSLVGVV